MKTRAYIRIARTPGGRKPYRIDARNSPYGGAPLTDTMGRALPTVAFAIDFMIPDELFKQAEHVIAEIEIPEAQAEILAEVRPLEPRA